MRQLAIVLACALAPSITGAQFPDRVQPGARVRLWIPEAYNQENGIIPTTTLPTSDPR